MKLLSIGIFAGLIFGGFHLQEAKKDNATAKKELTIQRTSTIKYYTAAMRLDSLRDNCRKCSKYPIYQND